MDGLQTHVSIPIVLLLGFLGAGKTTLLANLLKSEPLAGMRAALIVNEYGGIPVDSVLLASKTRPDHVAIREICGGSIFCVSEQNAMARELEYLATRVKPEVVVVEAAGLVPPIGLAAMLHTMRLSDAYHKATAITVVDALNFPKLYRSSPSVAAQIREADIVVVNKTDLVEVDQLDMLETKIRMVNTRATLYRSAQARFPFVEADLLAARPAPSSGETARWGVRPEGVEACELRTNTPVDKIKFYDFLFSNSPDILRAKGVVSFGSDSLHIEVVNGQIATLRPQEGFILDPAHRTAMSFVVSGVKVGQFLAMAHKTLTARERGWDGASQQDAEKAELG